MKCVVSLTLLCAVACSLPLCAQGTAPAAPQSAVHVAYPTGPGTALGAQVAALLADPRVARAHWGVAVTDLDGTPIYGLDEGKLFRPASNAKLFTTGAATAMLGLDKRFTTRVVAEGRIEGSALRGDLVLQGRGDANFASGYTLPYLSPAERAALPATPRRDPVADLDELAANVAATGLKTVDGDLIGDDSYFENTPYAEGWAIDDMLWGYGAPVSALTVHDNQLDLTITAGVTPKQQPAISLVPDLPFYTINKPAPGTTWTPTVVDQDFGHNQVLIERDPGSRDLRIMGDVAAKYPPEKDELAIDAPADYAALALRAALERHGVTIRGHVLTRHWDSGFTGSFLKATHEPDPMAQVQPNTLFFSGTVVCESQKAYLPRQKEPEQHVLAEHISPELKDDLKLTLKVSQNLHAEMMLRNIAAEKSCEHTLRRGVQLVRQYWLRAGLDGDDFEFYDGSGLSSKDLVTPRSVAQLLAYATRQPWFPQWKAALPVGGEDGSLASRFKGPPLADHVFAKTGTLGESRALSGYLDCKSGKQVIFSVIVDDHSPTTSEDRVVMDKIVAAIAANN